MQYTVVKSDTFLRWLKALRDRRAVARIAIRIDRIEDGNFGDIESSARASANSGSTSALGTASTTRFDRRAS